MLNTNKSVTLVTKNSRIVAFLKSLLLFEPILLLTMVYCFWYPIEIRYQWLGLLVGVPIFMLIRVLAYGRLFTRFHLDIGFIIFILLCILNLYLSPFTSPHPLNRLYLLGRPLLGIALCVYSVEYARLYKNLNGLLLATLVVGIIIGAMALFSSNWNTKSDQLRFIINILPRYANFPGASGGFNANEIAGGLSWIVPLCAGLMLWRGQSAFDRIIRWGFATAFGISFTALYLGQSRFAIAGVLFALLVTIYWLVPRSRWRVIACTAVILLAVIELMIVRNVFTPPGETTLASRDEASVNTRFDIWESVFKIVKTYPLTGVGMNMFREKAVRSLYPVPSFTQSVLPHAHNELLQMAADLGIPGFVLYLIWHVVIFKGLARTYRLGDANLKVIAVAVAGGLIAHLIFGMGDAVTLWDRLAFLFWWILAIGSAALWLSSTSSEKVLSHKV